MRRLKVKEGKILTRNPEEIWLAMHDADVLFRIVLGGD